MYFTEQGESLPALVSHIKHKYGHEVQILEQKTMPKRGISGMLGNQIYEIKGFCPDAQPHSNQGQASDLQAAIRDIAAAAQAPPDDAVSQRHLNQLHQKIDLLIKKSSAKEGGAYPELNKIEQLLIDNDFSYSFTQQLLQKARRFFTIEQIRQTKKCHTQIIDWIAEHIQVARWDEVHNTKIHILIGPTGAGKTTTLAKIAKLLAYGTGTKKIATIGLLTIDNYRLAAKEQLDGYGRSMGAPVTLVRNANELKSALAIHEKDRHVLIDTIGRSPYESTSLGSMNQLLRNCGKEATCSLVVSATTKQSDLSLIKKHYRPFDFRSIIVTKLDETDTIGNIISAFAEDDTPLVYYTNGQKVPLDISDASRQALVTKVFGFSTNKNSLSQR